MSWTFTQTLPTTRDKVRQLIGDTDSTAPLIADEALDYVLTYKPTIRKAAAEACRYIAAKFARDATTSVSGFSATLMSRHEQYLKMAEEWDAQGSAAGVAVPTAGGIEETDRLANDEDTSLQARLFRIGLHDNPAGLTAADLTEAGA